MYLAFPRPDLLAVVFQEASECIQWNIALKVVTILPDYFTLLLITDTDGMLHSIERQCGTFLSAKERVAFDCGHGCDQDEYATKTGDTATVFHRSGEQVWSHEATAFPEKVQIAMGSWSDSTCRNSVDVATIKKSTPQRQEILRLSSIDAESRYGLRERIDSYGKLIRQHVQKLSGRQTINTAAESAHCKFIQHYYTSITTPVCIPHLHESTLFLYTFTSYTVSVT